MQEKEKKEQDKCNKSCPICKSEKEKKKGADIDDLIFADEYIKPHSEK